MHFDVGGEGEAAGNEVEDAAYAGLYEAVCDGLAGV